MFFIYNFYTLNWKAWFNRMILLEILFQEASTELQLFVPNWKYISFFLFLRDTILLELKENVTNLFCTGMSQPGDTSLFLCCNLAILFSKKMQPFDGNYKIDILHRTTPKRWRQRWCWSEEKTAMKNGCCWGRKPRVHLLYFEVSRSPRKVPSLPARGSYWDDEEE